MRERQVEAMLRKTIEKRGGMCMKFTSPGLDGVPDRLCLLDGHAFFVETKSPGGRMRALQELRKEQLESQGFAVYLIDRPGKILEVLDEVQTT